LDGLTLGVELGVLVSDTSLALTALRCYLLLSLELSQSWVLLVLLEELLVVDLLLNHVVLLLLSLLVLLILC
jgi:hypothetical protein